MQYLSQEDMQFLTNVFTIDVVDNLQLLEKIEQYYSKRSPHISEIYNQASKHAITFLLSEKTLPGPTGESNILSLHARGNILCMGGDNIFDIHNQIALALASNNEITVLSPINQNVDPRDTERRLKKISITSDDWLNKLLDYDSNEAITAVACDGSKRKEIAAKIACLDGPIMPILSGNDDKERYAIERCVTIDTTAAGGNASLLAAG